MLIPPDFHPFPGSYDGLLKRMTRRVRENNVDLRLREILQQAFEMELSRENVTLSRPERVRLFRQIARTVLTDALEKIDDVK